MLDLTDEATLDDVNNEMQAHWDSQTESSVNLLGYCIHPPCIYVVLELCELGSLFDVLHGDQESQAGLDTAARLQLGVWLHGKLIGVVAIDCATAIEVIHERGARTHTCPHQA